MDAIEVQPNDWLLDKNYPIRVLFDDGEYSVIWGMYRDVPALGVRWNGGTDRGYPGQGAHPTWYIEPDFIASAILNRLLTLSFDSSDATYRDDIRFAIAELDRKMFGTEN